QKNGKCSITVDFSKGTFDGSNQQGLPTGPGEYSNFYGTAYGVGFTVTLGVFDGGGIGNIGGQSNPRSPGGTWSFNQQATVQGVVNREPQNITRDVDIDLSAPHELHANNVTYWDHPGVEPGKGNFAKFKFRITATNGKEKCEVNFFLNVSSDSSTVQWGEL